MAGRAAGATMVLLTMIARVADGLPLAASMQEDEQVRPAGRGRGGDGLSVRSGRGATHREPRCPFSQQGGSGTGACFPVVAGGVGIARRCCGAGAGSPGAPRCVRYRPSSRSPPSLPPQSGRDLQQYQSQAKQLFRKLNEQSPTRCTLEAGAMAFQ